MITKIMSLQDGVKTYNDCIAIKIKSSKYNLLIMEGHAPLIGEIKGSIEVTLKNDKITLDNVNGYYLNLDNTYKQMLR